MPIQVQCGCGARLRANDALAGKTLQCPKCKGPVSVGFPDNPEALGDGLDPGTPTQIADPHGGKKIAVCLWFSALAFVLSVVAIVLNRVVAPNTLPGSGIEAYDLSTPKSAYLSTLKMTEKKDFRALTEVQAVGSSIEEKLATLKVHRQIEYKGQVILFVSYEKGGVKEHDLVAMEKDAKSGYWTERFFYAPRPDLVDEQEDKMFAIQFTKWKEKGEL